MNKFVQKISSFSFWRSLLEKVSFFTIAGIGGLLCLTILETEREMTKLRKEQLQYERIQAKLANFQAMQTLTELSYRERKNFESVLESYSKSLGSKFSTQDLERYRDFLNGRGEMSTFSNLSEEIFLDLEEIKRNLTSLPTDLRGPNLVIALSDVKNYFSKMQGNFKQIAQSSVGHEQYLASDELLSNSLSALKILQNEKAFEKNLREFKPKLTASFENLNDKISALKNKNSFVVTEMPVVFKISKLLSNMESRLSDNIGIYNAYIRLGHEHITQVAMFFGLGFLALFVLGFGRTFARTTVKEGEKIEVVQPEASIEMPVAFEMQSSDVSDFMSQHQTTATAVTDSQENIVWASKSFYTVMGLNQSQKYNWNDLMDSHLVRSNSALGVEGAVTVTSRPNQDFKLISRTPKSPHKGAENRIIELVPIYNYHQEMQKTIQKLSAFTEIPGVEIYEVGETISEVAAEISYLFQTADIMFKVDTEKQIFVGFDKTVMRKNLKTLMTGLVIYMNQVGAKRLSGSFKKVGDSFSMTFDIAGQKFKEVNAPLNFRDKTYPSLSAYLEQVEDGLKKYSAEVTLKNVHADNEDHALITWGLVESDDALFNMETLEKKRRVHRVVKTAEKIKNASPAAPPESVKKPKASKIPYALRPKDFQ